MLLLANFATTSITSAVSGVDTSLPVASVAAFPVLSGGDYFYAVIQDVSDKRRQEIVKVVGGSSGAFDVERTAGLAFPAGSLFELRLTAQALYALMGDGALYHKHAQDALETDIQIQYTDGLVTSMSSMVLGLPRAISYSYIGGQLSRVEEVFAGIKRVSSMVYSGDSLVSINVSEVPA